MSYVDVQIIGKPNCGFQKSDAISFTRFSIIAWPKSNDLLWNFGYLLVVYSFLTYICFWIHSKFWILLASIFGKATCKKMFHYGNKKMGQLFSSAIRFSYFGVFRLLFTRNCYASYETSNIRHLFTQNSVTSLEHHFKKNVSVFYWNIDGRRQIHAG